MSHANAALTPRHRLKIARLVVDDGWPISEVAARFQVSRPTVKRWVDRYQAGESWKIGRRARERRQPWRDTCQALSITPKRTRPYRQRTNGKVERFHRTMADGWAYARCYRSEQERRDALPDWLHEYNQHRPHTACGNQPPFSRLINVPGQYN